jgi:hypothetical protein
MHRKKIAGSILSIGLIICSPFLLTTRASADAVPSGGSSAASPRTVGSTVDPKVAMGARPRPDDGHWAPAPFAGGPISNLVSNNINAGGCTYQQANDDPHFSSTAGDVSMHAWWNYAGGTCPATSLVTGGLQGYFCSSMFGCRWVTVATDNGSYKSGGGSGRRATPRITCSGSGLVGWRGWTDVDLPGINDPADVTYSTIVNLSCTP